MTNEIDTCNHGAVPEGLKALPRWLCWRYEERGGKPTKVPYDARSGRKASSTDPSTWTDFDTALAASHAYDGIGIVLGDGLAGVDLDNSVDENGNLKPWAQQLVSRLDSYTEFSPSGRGVKVFLRGSLKRTGNRRDLGDGHIEVYSADRYFTVTGHHLAGTPKAVQDREAALDELHLELFPPQEDPPATRPAEPLDLSDRDLLDRMFASSNADRIRRLWEGDIAGYPSHSEADAALCAHLAFWTGGDRDRMDRLFRQSGLCREKWTGRADYRTRTISKALEGLTDIYSPPAALDVSGVDISGIVGSPRAEKQTVDDPGLVPTELLRVPGFISEVMDYTLRTAPYPNPVLAFTGALCLQGFLAGRKVRDGANNRTNLYLLALADSGTGKDHPRKVNQRILLEVGLRDCVGDAYASGEGIEDRLYAQPSMLFQTDEIDRVMIAMKEGKEQRFEGIMQMLMKMYTSSDGVYPMRVKAGKEHRVIDQPSLCILGTAVPSHYYEALSEKMLTNGFFARMLVMEAGPRGPGQEPVPLDLPESVIEAARWWANFRPGTGNLQKWHPIPRVVEYTPAAREALVQFRTAADREYNNAQADGDTVAMAIWARAAQKARRLALIYACSENHECPRISEDAVRWATALVMHQTRRMLFMAYGHVADNPFHAECLKVIEKLRNAPDHELDHSTLLKRMKMDARSFRELIDTLLERGDIGVRHVPTAGRTGTYYHLAPGAEREKPGEKQR